MEKRVSKIIGSCDLTIETGKLAKLADGSVTVRSGETIILVAAVSAIFFYFFHVACGGGVRV